MKPKRTISSYILLVGILGLSIVGGVIAFQIYTALTKTQISTEQDKLIKPLEGSIDKKAIENLQQRVRFNDSQMNSQISYSESTGSASVVERPTPTQTSTSSGNIIP